MKKNGKDNQEGRLQHTLQKTRNKPQGIKINTLQSWSKIFRQGD